MCDVLQFIQVGLPIYTLISRRWELLFNMKYEVFFATQETGNPLFWAGRPGVRIPVRARFCLFFESLGRIWRSTHFLIQLVPGSLPGVTAGVA
jgi:hypothetical protein